MNRDEKILDYVIQLKEGQSKVVENVEGIKSHLAKMNGSIAKNQSDIAKIKLTMAKWVGGAFVLMFLIQIVIAKLL